MIYGPRLSSVVTCLCVLYAGVLTLVLFTEGPWAEILSKASPHSNISSHMSSYAQQLLDSRPKHESVTRTATVIRTVTARPTATTTETLTVMQTVTPAVPGPAYCNECGPEDALCQEYGRHNLQRSRAFEGTNSRLKRVLRKAASGQPINIGILGGSVSAGQAVRPGEVWLDLFSTWWRKTFPHEGTVIVNGAIPAIVSDYYASCALGHIDENVDLVLIELAINDPRHDFAGISFEWLVRLLLQLPNNPAIVKADVFSPHFELLLVPGDIHLPVAQYYDIPTVSMRNVMLNQFLEHNDLMVEMYKPKHIPEAIVDSRHMNRVGNKIMGDLLIAYFQRIVCQIAAEDARAPDSFTSPDGLLPLLDTMEQIPRLRLYSHYDEHERVKPVHPTCMSTRIAKSPLVPTRTNGWAEWSWGPKKYLVGHQPGDSVTFSLDIGPNGQVKLDYLRSKTFGLGMVRCWVNGDVDHSVVIDGHWEQEMNVAQGTELVQGYAPGPAEVTCEVLEETHDPSGGHEFRLIALTRHVPTLKDKI